MRRGHRRAVPNRHRRRRDVECRSDGRPRSEQIDTRSRSPKRRECRSRRRRQPWSTLGARAGDPRHTSTGRLMVCALPAATTTVMPSLTNDCTELSTAKRRRATDADVHDRRRTRWVIGDHPIERIDELRCRRRPAAVEHPHGDQPDVLGGPERLPADGAGNMGSMAGATSTAIVSAETIEDGRETGSHQATEVDVVGTDARVDDVPRSRRHPRRCSCSCSTGATIVGRSGRDPQQRRTGLGDDGRVEQVCGVEGDHLIGLDAGDERFTS